MTRSLIPFDALDWQDGISGARFKVFQRGNKRLRLLELTSGFVEPDWCENGHAGFVVQGELEIDFRGDIVRCPEGSGLFIPAGAANAHKASPVTPTVLLFLVEDI